MRVPEHCRLLLPLHYRSIDLAGLSGGKQHGTTNCWLACQDRGKKKGSGKNVLDPQLFRLLPRSGTTLSGKEHNQCQKKKLRHLKDDGSERHSRSGKVCKASRANEGKAS